MNTAIFWRLVWKEYRQQRALWGAIAGAGLILQAAVLAYCTLNGIAGLADKLFTVALSVPILYSLGCGAALFAAEHESGTFPFQQSLPVRAGGVFLAKFTFAVLSALALFPVLWLLAFAMTSWKLPDALWHAQLWGGGVVATIEVLIWATLGSLVLRRVLPAAVVSGVIAALLGYGSLVLVMAFGGLLQRQANEYFSTLPLRSGFAMIALAIAVQYGRQWFNEWPTRWRRSAAKRPQWSLASQRRAAPATAATILTRLVWHEWRQGRATMLWCTLGYVVLGTWLAVAQSDSMAYVGLLPVVATIFGASAFAADQRQSQYQFFTEHGVRPRQVWFSRQLVWGFALVTISGAATLLQMLSDPLPIQEVEAIVSLVGLAFVVFASSQLCSLLIRSGIVAVFTAALCSFLLAMWMCFMFILGVPWLLAAAPLPFIFLGASWLYAPQWIQLRYSWRVRTATAATILVPLSCVVAATAAYRVYEIPAIVLSFDPTVSSETNSPAAIETAAMYREAEQMLRGRLTTDSTDGSPGISLRDDQWQTGIQLFLAASQRETCHFYHWYDAEPGSPFDGKQLTRAVIAESLARVEEGDLQGAATLHDGLLQLAGHFYHQDFGAWYRSYGTAVEWEVFFVLPKWANHPALTVGQLQQTLDKLRTWSASNRPDWEASVTEHRRNMKRFIALDDEIMRDRYGMEATERGAIKALSTLLPWERLRMSRLLDVYTEAELQGIREVRHRAVGLPPQAQRSLEWDVRLDLGGGKQQLIRSTDVQAWLNTTRWLHMTSTLNAPSYVLWEKQYQVRRNAVQLQLALLAWRKRHSQLPESLHELLDDRLQSLPRDPYTNRPFLYFPDGIEEEIWDEAYPFGGMMMGIDEMGAPESTEEAAPPEPRLVRSEPFLWSPGEQLQFVSGASRDGLEPPAASDFRDQQGKTLTEQNLLHQGVQYLIPTKTQPPSDSSDDAAALPSRE